MSAILVLAVAGIMAAFALVILVALVIGIHRGDRRHLANAPRSASDAFARRLLTGVRYPVRSTDSPSPQEEKRSDAVMTISIPMVALFGIGAYLAWRFMGLRLWQAAMCMICGFLVAGTSAAPQVSHVLAAITQWIHL